MRKLFFLAAAVCSLLCTACGGSGNQVSQYSHAGLDSVLKKQVLLANDAEFTDEQLQARGSAFLMRHENELWAVTALPWIMQDTGYGQIAKIGQLKGAIKSWHMYPRVAAATDTFPVTYDSTQNSAYNEDVLFLKAPNGLTQFAELKPQFELPTIDDTLFLVGCPTAEPGCRQNVYPLVFQKYAPKVSELSFILCKDADLNGFGGAPILNRRGEVVALLAGGGYFMKLQVIYATHIAAIKRLRQ